MIIAWFWFIFVRQLILWWYNATLFLNPIGRIRGGGYHWFYSEVTFRVWRWACESSIYNCRKIRWWYVATDTFSPYSSLFIGPTSLIWLTNRFEAVVFAEKLIKIRAIWIYIHRVSSTPPVYRFDLITIGVVYSDEIAKIQAISI